MASPLITRYGPAVVLVGLVGGIGYSIVSDRRLKQIAKHLPALARKRGVPLDTHIGPPMHGRDFSYVQTIAELGTGHYNPRQAFEIERAQEVLGSGEFAVLTDAHGERYLDYPHPMATKQPRVRVAVEEPVDEEGYETGRSSPAPQPAGVLVAANPSADCERGDWCEVLPPGVAAHDALRRVAQARDLLGVVDMLDRHFAAQVNRRLKDVACAWYPDGTFKLPVGFRFEDGPPARLWLRWATG